MQPMELLLGALDKLRENPEYFLQLPPTLIGSGFPNAVTPEAIPFMFLNLMFKLLHNQKQNQTTQLSPCMIGFSPPSPFPPALLASSTLSKGAVEFRPQESRPPENAGFHKSTTNQSLIYMQDPMGCISYVHSCFPRTRPKNTATPRADPISRDSSFFSSFQRLGPSILHNTNYNFPFSSPRSFNSQSPVGASNIVKKQKKKSNLKRLVLSDLRKNHS